MKSKTCRFKLGNFECFIINDHSSTNTAYQLIVNANQELLERVASEIDLNPDKIPVDYNCLLVNTGDQNVLIDTGFGRRFEGLLHPGLKFLGFDPGDIDVIIITHSDYDHIGGILDKEGQPAFPNAHYFISEDA